MVSSRNHRLLAGWALALLLMSGFAALGNWQLARMQEKQRMLAAAAHALDPAQRRSPQPLQRAADSERAKTYDWAAGHGALRKTTVWLDNQVHAGRPGVRMYCLLQPDTGGQAVLLDVGWWPLDGQRRLPAASCPAVDSQVVRGLLAPPPAVGLAHGPALTRQADVRWLAVRLVPSELAAALRLDAGIAPRVLRLDPDVQPEDTGVMRVPGLRDLTILPNTLPPERHLGYAVQWFGLALATLVVALVLTLRRQRHD